MSIKEDIKELEKSLSDIREQSFAMEILEDYKKDKKRLFIIILVVLVMLFITTAYLVYVLNDIGTEEIITETTTQDVPQENTNGDNNFIGHDGDINNGETKN